LVGQHVTEHLGEPHGGRCLEVPVVESAPNPIMEAVGIRNKIVTQARKGIVAGQLIAYQFLNSLTDAAQRVSRCVDGESRLVAEEMPRHGGQHEAERRIDLGNLYHGVGVEARLPRWRKRSVSPCAP